MATHHRRALMRAIVVIGLISPALAQEADVTTAVSTFSTLYRFPGAANGYSPRGGVVRDTAGNLYGTTQYDGLCSTCGLIYKLTHPAPGKTAWTYSVLHKFKLGTDGIHPTGPLIIHNNVIYGTTSAGGDPTCGCGTVFKIGMTGAGYKILHVFTRPNSHGGSTPIAGLLVDAGGTFYGVTNSGGAHGAGTLYKITSGGAFSVLHHFAGQFNGGPQGELMFGKDKAIYGTQFGGGKYNQGVVFRITTGGAYKVLYDFKGVNQPGGSHDGAQPEGRLAQGSDGTIFGTTSFGGTPLGYGTAWSLKLTAGKWVYKQLRIFSKTPQTHEDANLPHSGFVLDTNGVLYGTGAGGGHFQSGAVYRLTPPTTAGGTWGYKTLHSFYGRNPYGDTPYGVLLLHNHLLYGMNLLGGHIAGGGSCNNGCGTVFQLKP